MNGDVDYHCKIVIAVDTTTKAIRHVVAAVVVVVVVVAAAAVVVAVYICLCSMPLFLELEDLVHWYMLWTYVDVMQAWTVE